MSQTNYSEFERNVERARVGWLVELLAALDTADR